MHKYELEISKDEILKDNYNLDHYYLTMYEIDGDNKIQVAREKDGKDYEGFTWHGAYFMDGYINALKDYYQSDLRLDVIHSLIRKECK